ncbi:hypothetical protein NIES4102_20990 [Chondrocystis sp. NIES-4102]|nr:hypothetical protein NIES4102_20990 [Chondrocystis sp. NIES-4102]
MKKSKLMRFLLPLVLCLTTLLTGCVNYDVGLSFATPYSGEITQHIKVTDTLNNLAPSDSRKWLNSLEERSRQLEGNVKKINATELVLTIPFSNGAELAHKFNQLFQTSIVPNATIPKGKADLIQLNSHIDLHQSNLILVERNSLDLAIDLRALKVLSNQDKIQIDPDSLANIELQLNTPWLARNVASTDNIQPIRNPLRKGLIWQLHPGEVNHIQAVFWLPSPLGIGSALIILLMLGGFFLKYRRFPGFA